MSGPGDDPRVKIEARETAYDGFSRLETLALRHQTHDGGWTPVLKRELIERGRTAAVLPYDPARDAVVLVEQFRIGAHGAGMDPWLVEAVAGVIEDGETADDVARREAVEEAGCELGELIGIGTFMLTPGVCSEACTMFCGRVDSRGKGGVHGLAEEDEDILVHVVPAGDAIARALAGEVPSAYGAIPLMWLASNRDTLRERWR